MKKSTALHRFIFTIMTMALLISACTPNAPKSGGDVGPTSTPTASSGSGDGNSTLATVPPSTAESTPVPLIDICSFFTPAEVEPIVGTALIDATPGGDIDEITGGPLDYCTYKGDDVAMMISVVRSKAAEGSQEWKDQILNIAQASDPEAAITPESGLGEQAFWVVTEDSAGWFVAEYPYVFGLAVGGNIGYSEDYKEDLKGMAHKVLDALP